MLRSFADARCGRSLLALQRPINISLLRPCPTRSIASQHTRSPASLKSVVKGRHDFSKRVIPPLSGALPEKSSHANTTQLKRAYPERILIYHAGKPRIIFIACVKLTGIFLFLFSTFILAPAYYYSPFEPTWMAPLCVTIGAIPMIIMSFTMAPFTNKVYLHLPLWARASNARLHRFAGSLPPSAELEFETVKLASIRQTRVRAEELYVHEVMRAMNLRREIPERVRKEIKWYQRRPIKSFYVGGKSSNTTDEPGSWEGVIGSIVRGWGQRRPNNKVLAEKKP